MSIQTIIGLTLEVIFMVTIISAVFSKVVWRNVKRDGLCLFFLSVFLIHFIFAAMVIHNGGFNDFTNEAAFIIRIFDVVILVFLVYKMWKQSKEKNNFEFFAHIINAVFLIQYGIFDFIYGKTFLYLIFSPLMIGLGIGLILNWFPVWKMFLKCQNHQDQLEQMGSEMNELDKIDSDD